MKKTEMESMKKFVVAFALLLPFTSLSAKKLIVEISNPAEEQRTDVPVVLNVADLKLKTPVRSATVWVDGREIPSQTDDLNDDGAGDEIAFVLDMPAKSTVRADIELSDTVAAPDRYTSRVYADLLIADKKKGKHARVHSISTPMGRGELYNLLHHHGPAFESELVAYRLYFDHKQTVDIYGKFNKGFEVEASGWYPNDDQLAAGFGDDVLRVSGSCGAGTLKAWNGKKAKHIEPVAGRSTRIWAYGPVRTIVDMSVVGWQYEGTLLDMTCRYTLYAGHRDCEVEVLFAKPLQNELFCTGVQDLPGSVSYSDHKGLIASWGTDWPVNDTIKYAKETVGLAAYIPEQYVKAEVKDKVNYLYTVGQNGATRMHYYISFSSMKETFGYKTPEAWFEYARRWRDGLNTPCTVKIKKK